VTEAALKESPHCPERLLSERLRFSDGRTEARFSPLAAKAKDALVRKVREGSYAFEETACFCGEPSGETVATVDRYGLWYPLVLCGHCGLLRANPRMTREAYIGFYGSEYRALYGDADADFDALYESHLAQGRDAHSFVRSHVKAPLPVVLDVGCNLGTILLPFAADGSEVFGVDFGGEYLKLGRERTGLKNLIEGDVSAFLALGRKADLIICSHSVEHFLDLEGELARLRAALAPGGRLFVTVPGTRHFTDVLSNGNVLELLQNAHTWQFENETLDYVMECCGFRRDAADDQIRSIYSLSEARRDKKDVPSGAADRARGYLRGTERGYMPRWYAKRLLAALGLRR
jgi:SAM-dependent methyltransferase